MGVSRGGHPPSLLGFVGQKTPWESKMGKGVEAVVRIRIASWGNLMSLFVIFGLYCSDKFFILSIQPLFFRTK